MQPKRRIPSGFPMPSLLKQETSWGQVVWRHLSVTAGTSSFVRQIGIKIIWDK